MISVDAALARIFELVSPLGPEAVFLRHASGRVLASDASASRDQPPFAASAMDGYAARAQDTAPNAVLTVVGESAAGARFDGAIVAGQAVRIFTGAPVPEGANCIIIQEDVQATGDRIQLADAVVAGTYVRPAGGDFQAGSRIAAGTLLAPKHIGLMASMNIAQVQVHRRPSVAVLATGDELVMPGETPGPDQIVSSNVFGLAALFERAGADARILPIARDTVPSLKHCLALAAGCDLIVTTGGASVGDHDLMALAAEDLGLSRNFYKVAMRPGKPLMAGNIAGIPLIGLPGNPVSAMVCGSIFVLPALNVLMGLMPAPAPRSSAVLATAIEANGPREHYMRATLRSEGVAVLDRQDSSLQRVLANADVLVVRPPHDPSREAGDEVQTVLL